MARLFRLALALAITAGLVPHAAVADHTCVSDVSILSRVHTNAGVEEPTANLHELLVCPSGANTDPFDTRILLPGANQVSIRYSPNTPPLPESPPVTAQVSGLINGAITLTPRESLPGTRIWTYASEWIALPPGADGSITATVAGDTTTYSTVN